MVVEGRVAEHWPCTGPLDRSIEVRRMAGRKPGLPEPVDAGATWLVRTSKPEERVVALGVGSDVEVPL